MTMGWEILRRRNAAAEDPSPGRILERVMQDRWAPTELHRLGSQTDV